MEESLNSSVVHWTGRQCVICKKIYKKQRTVCSVWCHDRYEYKARQANK